MPLPIALAALAEPVIDLAKEFISKDKLTEFEAQLEGKKIDLEAKALEYASTQAEYQNKVNEAQAKNPSLFVSGARPAVIWGSLFVLLYAAFLKDWINVGLIQAGLSTLPPVSGATLGWATSVLLGLCGLRGVERIRGVARNNMTHTPSKSKLDT